MINLLPGFIKEKSVLTGVLQYRKPRLCTLIEHNIADSFYIPDEFICPRCYQKLPAESNKPKAIRWIALRFCQILTRLTPEIPYWIIALYRRK
jgi:hypothetical protein